MENSHISWTDHTFNPWIGCTKVSPGCVHCYAEARDQRFAGGAHWGNGAPRQRTSAANWKQPLKWNAAFQRLEDFMEGQRLRPRVFCASLADWLDDEAPIEWFVDLLALVFKTPNLDWLLLTKRPHNFTARMTVALALRDDGSWEPDDVFSRILAWIEGNPPANVWLGTTVEDQTRAVERVPVLLSIPAKVRFLSCEPLLGPLNLTDGLGLMGCPGDVHWVICGGESGHGARPMHPEWARALRDQCESANVPFHFKQWGVWVPGEEHYQGPEWMFQNETLMDSHWFPDFNENPTGWKTDYHSVPGSVVVWRNVGTKYAGRLLDGVPYDAIPRLSNEKAERRGN